jgi:hypothetical protein
LRFAEFGGSFWEVGVAVGEARCLAHLSTASTESLQLRNAGADATFWLRAPAEKIRVFSP